MPGRACKDVGDKLGNVGHVAQRFADGLQCLLEVEDQFVGDEEQDEQRLEVEQDLFEDEEKKIPKQLPEKFSRIIGEVGFFDRAVEEGAGDDEADLVVVHRGAVEVRAAGRGPHVVDDGGFAVHVHRHHVVAPLTACAAARFFRSAPEGVDAQMMSATVGGAAELVDVVDLAIRIAGKVGTQVQDQDNFQARLGGVLHPRDERIDYFVRGEVLVLDVDVTLSVGNGTLIGFEDAGFTVGQVFIAGVDAFDRAARQRAQDLHRGHVAVGRDRQVGKGFRRRDEHGLAGGIPDACERFLDMGDRRPAEVEIHVVHERALVARVTDGMAGVAEVILFQRRPHEDGAAPVHHDGLGMQQCESLVVGVGVHPRGLCEELRHFGHGIFCRERQVGDENVDRLAAFVFQDVFQRGLGRLFATVGRGIQRVEAGFEFGEEAVVDVEKERHEVDGFGGRGGGVGHCGKHRGPVDQRCDAVMVKERDRVSGGRV